MKKLNVAICDENEIYCNKLKMYLKQFFSDNERFFSVTTFKESEHFVDNYNKQYDIIFLTIEMDGNNNIEVARSIRNIDNQVVIIFVTTTISVALSGYEVRAYRCLVKPVNYEVFETCMKVIIEENFQTKKGLVVKSDGMIHNIEYLKIIYIETFGHKINFHLKDGTLVVRESLKNIEKQLDDTFYKIHKSFIINKNMIKGFNNKSVIMNNDDELPISRNNIKEFKQVISKKWQIM